MTRFLLVRHAINPTVGKTLAGRSPGVVLSETGRLQAEAVAASLSGLPIAAVYSSPLERATETAAPIAKHFGLSVVTADEFAEIEFGEWTSRSIDDLRSDVQFQRFNTFRSCTRIPGGELMAEAQLRMVQGLEKLRQQHRDEVVVVVSHADMIKAAIAFYAGIHIDLFQRIEIAPASVSTLAIDDDTARILGVNYTGGINI